MSTKSGADRASFLFRRAGRRASGYKKTDRFLPLPCLRRLLLHFCISIKKPNCDLCCSRKSFLRTPGGRRSFAQSSLKRPLCPQAWLSPRVQGSSAELFCFPAACAGRTLAATAAERVCFALIPIGIRAKSIGIGAIPIGIRAKSIGIGAIPIGIGLIPAGIVSIPTGIRTIPIDFAPVPIGIRAKQTRFPAAAAGFQPEQSGSAAHDAAFRLAAIPAKVQNREILKKQ